MTEHTPSTLSQEDINEDIRYFKEKLAQTFDEPGRKRLEHQIGLLEDAVVIYRITRATVV